MVFGIVLTLACVAGVILGVVRRSRALVIGSAVLLVLVIAVWIYFYQNPY